MKKCLIVYSDYYKEISKNILNGALGVLKKIKFHSRPIVLMVPLKYLN